MFIGTFQGNLGRDGELNYLNTGSTVLNFAVGVTTGWGDKQKTIWVKCAIFGKRAEALSPMMLKGKKVLVSGSLSEQEWTGNDGVVKKNLACNATEVDILTPKDQTQNPQNHNTQQQQRPQQQPQQPAQQQPMQDEFDESIPPF